MSRNTLKVTNPNIGFYHGFSKSIVPLISLPYEGFSKEYSCTGFVYKVESNAIHIPAHVALLTAAHCLLNKERGGYNFQTYFEGKQVYRKLAHQKYHSDSLYDLAFVVVLKSDFRKALELKIATDTTMEIGDPVIYTGAGTKELHFGHNLLGALSENYLSTLDNKSLNRSGLEGSDSGSPVFNRKAEVVAIASRMASVLNRTNYSHISLRFNKEIKQEIALLYEQVTSIKSIYNSYQSFWSEKKYSSKGNLEKANLVLKTQDTSKTMNPDMENFFTADGLFAGPLVMVDSNKSGEIDDTEIPLVDRYNASNTQ